MVEFTLHEVLVASISQVMMRCNGKGIQIVNDLAEEIMSETLYGDSLRLQQVLADFLHISVHFTPDGGQLGVATTLTKNCLGEFVQLVHLDIRITHAGGGVLEELLGRMFGGDAEASEEGISLLVSRKLVKLMNGDVLYLREAGTLIDEGESLDYYFENIDETLVSSLGGGFSPLASTNIFSSPLFLGMLILLAASLMDVAFKFSILCVITN